MPTSAEVAMKLLDHELWWRDRYDWFQSCGYTLRSRYKPDWVASWKGSPIPFAHLLSFDGIPQLVSGHTYFESSLGVN